MAQAVIRPLEGKLAVVTGAFRGVGSAITRHLASKGAHVLGIAESIPAHEDISAQLSAEHGVKVVPLAADLRSPEAASERIIQAAKANFSRPISSSSHTLANDKRQQRQQEEGEGGERAKVEGKGQDDLLVNIIINNAGVCSELSLPDVTAEEYHRIYSVNVLAPMILTQRLAPFLPRDRTGRIVNISSVAAAMGFRMHTLYGGSKAALEAMTRTWSRELAERATVNAVNPGPVEGGMYMDGGQRLWEELEPFQRAAPLTAVREDSDRPDLVRVARDEMSGRRPAYWSEVASVVGMLCGEDARWCTGSVICANGGLKFST
ncbi:hypothetical protein N3K66_007132 [Trichothecium roseum]|uniref:Uncharacterized protein n=1 Tax=Trichothecium roseum TaxID=47278 RepID=A0ACC0UYL1_9HYPO|nr:hypothetical protein N3K66_007132 [Trichothecium roseum]